MDTTITRSQTYWQKRVTELQNKLEFWEKYYPSGSYPALEAQLRHAINKMEDNMELRKPTPKTLARRILSQHSDGMLAYMCKIRATYGDKLVDEALNHMSQVLAEARAYAKP